MNKDVTMLIQTDPLVSHRPCEGLRIALGLAASGLKLRLFLRGPALALLKKEKQDFVDEEELERYLPLLLDLIPSIFILNADLEACKQIDAIQDTKQLCILSQASLQHKIEESDIFLSF